MAGPLPPGTLEIMTIYDVSPTTTEFLSEEMQRWGNHGFHPAFFLIRLIVLIAVIAAVVIFFRRRRGLHAIGTLRDLYAKGEVDETEYRQRLAVLRETRK